jgi:alpha-tubulin suppressor-like RCC1 family protein
MKQNFYILLGLGLCLFFITGCLPTSQFGQSSTQPLISTFKIDASYPESDTSNSFNVFLRGSVPTNVKSIRFFNGTTCATQIGNGLSGTFKGVIGIPVNFPQGSVTSYNISAKLIYTNNIESGCYENIFLYKRTGSNALALVSAEPASPSRSPVEDSDPEVYQPLLKGVSSSSDIAYVRLYKNSNLCSTASLITPVDKTDSKLSIDDFLAGININLEADSITSIYIKGFLDNEYSNKEADSCHLLTTYNVDITSPNAPATITHRYFYPFQTSPSITWSASTDPGDAASGIKNYRYAIGLTDTPNEVAVLGWTETTSTSFMVNSSFQENIKYFVKVRAIDRAGNESATTVSHGWTVKTINTPALSIKSPESDNTIIANYITLSGTCVYGVTNPIRFQVSGGMNPIPDADCGINNQFSTLAQVISSVGNVRSITAIQNDGERDLAVTRTLIYAPLSTFGSTLAVGNQHTCTTKEGSLYCWGENTYTQLGIGDIAGPLYLPRRVSHSNINKPSYFFEQVGNGDSHSCGLSTDRVAYCWGDNSLWQLGNSSNFATETPVTPETPDDSPIPIKVNMSQVEGGTFKQISVGADHACGLSDTNKVYCWGSQVKGQIGNRPPVPPAATLTASASQVERPTLISIPGSVTQISSGHSHNCALTSVGDIWCWGYNKNRQLGNPSKITEISRDPVVVVPGGQMEAGEKFKFISAGSLHTCAITTKDDIFCWGAKDNGALGITPAVGNVSNPSIRINVTNSEGIVKFKSVSAGGTIYNLERSLDNPLEGDLAAASRSESAFNQHTCAISLGGKVYCWGQNENLQLGINNTDPPPQTGVPTEIILSGDDQTINFTEVKTGYFHTCAKGIKNAQETTFCWGGHMSGKLGIGNIDNDQASPTEINSDDYSN